MEIISNGLVGKKYCNYCNSVVKLNKEDIMKPILQPLHTAFWTCPVCGLNNRCIAVETEDDDE